MRQLKCKCHNGFITINGLSALRVDKLVSVVCSSSGIWAADQKVVKIVFGSILVCKHTTNRWNFVTNCYYRKLIVEKKNTNNSVNKMIFGRQNDA